MTASKQKPSGSSLDEGEVISDDEDQDPQDFLGESRHDEIKELEDLIEQQDIEEPQDDEEAPELYYPSDWEDEPVEEEGEEDQSEVHLEAFQKANIPKDNEPIPFPQALEKDDPRVPRYQLKRIDQEETPEEMEDRAIKEILENIQKQDQDEKIQAVVT